MFWIEGGNCISFRYYGLKNKKTLNVAQSGSDTTSPSLTTTASKTTDVTTTPIITVTTPSKGAIHNITSSPKKVNFFNL